MRCGDRGLVAIDLETGSLAWALDSAKKPKCEPLGIESVARFGPFLGTDGSSFFAQCEAECWRIDPATGTVDGEDETSLADWTFAPFAFKRLGLLRPTGTAALGVATANRRGPIFEAKRPASLSGFAPQARAIGRDVYVAFPRTIGYELQRLGDVGAANLWPSSRIANAMALHLELADADADSLYLPLPGKIVALSRDDGSETWQRDLPVLPDGIRWQVKAGRTRLLLHAERPLPRVSLREEISRSIRLLKSSPTPVRLLGVALNLAEWAAFTAIPLVVLDSESGTVLQKLSMPTIGHAARIAVRDETILIHHGGGIERIRK